MCISSSISARYSSCGRLFREPVLTTIDNNVSIRCQHRTNIIYLNFKESKAGIMAEAQQETKLIELRKQCDRHINMSYMEQCISISSLAIGKAKLPRTEKFKFTFKFNYWNQCNACLFASFNNVVGELTMNAAAQSFIWCAMRDICPHPRPHTYTIHVICNLPQSIEKFALKIYEFCIVDKNVDSIMRRLGK